MQEANSQLLRMHAQSMGFGMIQNAETGENAILAGASGVKCLRPLYENFNGIVNRPWATSSKPEERKALDMFVADVAWLDKPNGSFVSRAGLKIWRVCSVHFHYKAAHAPDSSTVVLVSLFQLMFRDKVRIVTGDFNQAWRCIDRALRQAVSDSDKIKWHVHYGQEHGAHIACIVLNYEGQPALTSERRSRVDNLRLATDWGLNDKDTSSHAPLIILFTSADTCAEQAGRSQMHKRSETAKKKRKRAERQRVKEEQEFVLAGNYD